MGKFLAAKQLISSVHSQLCFEKMDVYAWIIMYFLACCIHA